MMKRKEKKETQISQAEYSLTEPPAACSFKLQIPYSLLRREASWFLAFLIHRGLELFRSSLQMCGLLLSA